MAITILPDVWHCWLHGFCVVRGNLNKRVLIGGTYENFPVCNATVEVYEVDPIWIIIPKLPDLVLDRLRHIIVDPRPVPIPVPDPGPDPAPFARAAMLQQPMTRSRSKSNSGPTSSVPPRRAKRFASRNRPSRHRRQPSMLPR